MKLAVRRSMKDIKPSRASSVAIRRMISGSSARAASSSARYVRAEAIVAATPSGACAAIVSAIAIARSSCLPGVDDLLHEADAMRLVGAELVAGEQPAHRVAPAGASATSRNVAPPNGKMPRLISICAKRVVSAATHDVLREAQLDAEREAAAVHGDDGRLRARAGRALPHGSIPVAAEASFPSMHRGATFGEVEPGGEVIAVREDHAAADLGIALERAVRVAQPAKHVGAL